MKMLIMATGKRTSLCKSDTSVAPSVYILPLSAVRTAERIRGPAFGSRPLIL